MRSDFFSPLIHTWSVKLCILFVPIDITAYDTFPRNVTVYHRMDVVIWITNVLEGQQEPYHEYICCKCRLMCAIKCKCQFGLVVHGGWGFKVKVEGWLGERGVFPCSCWYIYDSLCGKIDPLHILCCILFIKKRLQIPLLHPPPPAHFARLPRGFNPIF